MMLCDCPGLVFPSFVSNTADLIAAGVYPIAQMRDRWPVIQLICQRIPRPIIEALYGIQLPLPSVDVIQQHHVHDTNELPPPTPEEFLGTLCIARGMLAAHSGVPDYQRAARMVIKDYANGRLLYCHPPPNLISDSAATVEDFCNETIGTALHNTEKLHEKLLRQQIRHEKTEQQYKKQQQQNDHGQYQQADPAAIDRGNDVLINDGILELLGASQLQDINNNNNNNSKNKHRGKSNNTEYERGKHGKKGLTPKSKWGKKDRKNRDDDPYGCHMDDLLLADDKTISAARTTNYGVVVNAGKYTHTGYTRPTSYPTLTHKNMPSTVR
jgi:hypothetical protein